MGLLNELIVMYSRLGSILVVTISRNSTEKHKDNFGKEKPIPSVL
jgi:hypothetical protein